VVLRLGNALFYPAAYGTASRIVIADSQENPRFLNPDSGLRHTDDCGRRPIDQTATTIYHAR
jgi:hypothetical protein